MKKDVFVEGHDPDRKGDQVMSPAHAPPSVIPVLVTGIHRAPSCGPDFLANLSNAYVPARWIPAINAGMTAELGEFEGRVRATRSLFAYG